LPKRRPITIVLYRNVMPEPMTVYIDEYRKKELPEGGF
jgi:hypothetical protein